MQLFVFFISTIIGLTFIIAAAATAEGTKVCFANATAFSFLFFICCMMTEWMNEWIISYNLADVSLAKFKPAPKAAKAGATLNPAVVTKKGKKQAKTTAKSSYSPAPKVKKAGKTNKKTPLTTAPTAFTGAWKTEPGVGCDTICSNAGLECNEDSQAKIDSVSFVFSC